MKTITIADVEISNRQRRDLKDLSKLKKSILAKGLLHAPVIKDGRLISGERRLTSMKELHEEGHTICYNGEQVPSFCVPYVTLDDLSDDDLMEAELEENLLREDLTWIEESDARAAIHEFRKKQNPNQSQRDTARELSNRSGKSFDSERRDLSEDIIIQKHKHDPRVKTAPNRRKAVTAILDDQRTKFRAILAERVTDNKSPHTIINGDCREVLPKLEKDTFSAIICDPPYGMNADNMGNKDKHFYEDSPDYALEICKFIIAEGFRLTKPKAVMFMFCDIDHFVTLRTHAGNHAWSPWRAPLIWKKGNDGHAPWGSTGFIRTYECCLFLSKGGQGTHLPGGPDVFEYARPLKSDRVHAAEKPVDLLERLLKLSALQGDHVLDPCCGSGSIVPAADRLNVRVTGVELDRSYYSAALARTQTNEPTGTV